MSLKTEGLYAPDVIKFEQPNGYSRDKITVLAGSSAERVLTVGMVLGRIATAAATVANGGAGVAGANTGNGTLTMDSTTPVKAGAKVGVYKVKFVAAATNNGTFVVIDPDGDIIGYVNMATGAGAFDDTVKFAIADGSTDFAIGDGFTITVAAGSGKYTQLNLTGADGSAVAAGVLVDNVTAPDGVDAYGVAVVRDAIIASSLLVWPAGASAGQKATGLAQLKALGIIARDSA